MGNGVGIVAFDKKSVMVDKGPFVLVESNSCWLINFLDFETLLEVRVSKVLSLCDYLAYYRVVGFLIGLCIGRSSYSPTGSPIFKLTSQSTESKFRTEIENDYNPFNKEKRFGVRDGEVLPLLSWMCIKQTFSSVLLCILPDLNEYSW